MKPVLLGDATLYHGDCLEVMQEIPDHSVDMIFTDPPYGHNNNNGDLISRREQALGHNVTDAEELINRRPIANDGVEANELFKECLPEFKRILKPGACCCCCCCGGGGPDPQFARWSLWIDEVLDFKQMVIWDKGPMGMGWHYRRSYETVLVAQKQGAACKWYDETNSIENIIRPHTLGIRKILPLTNQHPTEKPVQLPRHFIRLHSLPGEVVLDPFMGGGSTALASMKEGRKFIGIELDETYFTMSVDRITKALQQPRLFDEEPVKAEVRQGVLL